MSHELTDAFWRKSVFLRYSPHPRPRPQTPGMLAPNPAPGRHLLHIEASSQVPRTPSSSVSVGEEQVVKEGLLRLAAMGVEISGWCVHRRHGNWIDGRLSGRIGRTEGLGSTKLSWRSLVTPHAAATPVSRWLASLWRCALDNFPPHPLSAWGDAYWITPLAPPTQPGNSLRGKVNWNWRKRVPQCSPGSVVLAALEGHLFSHS